MPQAIAIGPRSGILGSAVVVTMHGETRLDRLSDRPQPRLTTRFRAILISVFGFALGTGVGIVTRLVAANSARVALAIVVAVVLVATLMWLLLSPPARNLVNRWVLRKSEGITDTFRRKDQKTGWGTASNGRRWHAPGQPWNVRIEKERGVIGFSGDVELSQWLKLGDHMVDDCLATVRFTISSVAIGTKKPTAGVFVRLQPDRTQYLARYDGQTEEIQFLAGPIGNHPNGRPLYDRSAVPCPIMPGRTYCLRLAVVGSSYFVSLWPEDQPQPARWMLQGSTPVHKPSGQLGLYGYGVDGGPDVRFHDYSVMEDYVARSDDVLRGT